MADQIPINQLLELEDEIAVGVHGSERVQIALKYLIEIPKISPDLYSMSIVSKRSRKLRALLFIPVLEVAEQYSVYFWSTFVLWQAFLVVVQTIMPKWIWFVPCVFTKE